MIIKSRIVTISVTASVLALGVALLASLSLAGPHHRHHHPDRDRGTFAVHEWGTFTSMQGANGVELDGMHHEGERLPAFVYSFARTLPSPFRDLGDASVSPPVSRTRSKMETPVIYFHSDRARDVQVSVGYVGGLMSHYYPAPWRINPAPLGDRPGAIDLLRVASSSLTWRARVEPAPENCGIPDVADNDPYGFARAVDAARVRVDNPATGASEYERFLFYRGLGRHNPAIHVAARPGGGVTLANHEADAMAAAFAVDMRADVGRFQVLGAIPGNEMRSFDGASTPLEPRERVIARLSERVFEVLASQGLHADEARAMVRTWSHQWFGDPGTRVLYIVPRGYVDRTLPLDVDPRPDAIVRVFVGRLEYLTPKAEAEIAGHVRATGAADASTRDAAMAELAALGRFMEPKIRRVLALARDPMTRERAQHLLDRWTVTAAVGDVAGADASDARVSAVNRP